jgi:signal transduction histidine kinase
MHFDDRLATVLRLSASGDALARIQYRQLVDLLSRMPADARSDMIDAGLVRIEELSRRIPASERTRLLRQPLQPITNARLLSLLAESEPDVATAAIMSARLSEADWLKLVPELPVRARGILRHRRDLEPRVEALLERLGIRDRGLPPVIGAQIPAADAGPSSPRDVLELVPGDVLPEHQSEWARAAAVRAEKPRAVDAGIGAIVRRIEEFRRAREAHPPPEPANDAPRLPLGDLAAATPRVPAAIDFAADQEGRITWAEGVHAPSLVGLRLAAHEAAARGISPAGPPKAEIARAIRHRLPLYAARIRISGAPAVSGDWQVDAVPCFDDLGGGFTGYCGRLRRPRPAARAGMAGAKASEADRMRQVLHELRTPANAIQVAAEIIQQQLYGPAPHEYRALAAAIAGDCAHILAGFEELDRLVKLESGTLQLEAGDCDIAPVLVETVARLRAWTDPRRSGFALPADIGVTALPVEVDRIEAERLVWRLLAALAGAAAPEEVLPLTWERDAEGRVALRIALPAFLAERDVADLFGAPAEERGQTLSAGMFGLGFTLRLAAAEAAAVGGCLQRDGKFLGLFLPGLTHAGTGHSTAAGHSR